MARVEISGAWEGEVDSAVEEFFDERLGPDIARDAKRYCPERSGSLMESIEHHLEDGDLIVSATGGDGGRVYAAYLRRARASRLPPQYRRGWARGCAPEPIFETCTISRTRGIGLNSLRNSVK